MVATKLYGLDWWPEVSSDPYQECADALQEAGVNVVLAQNYLDPLPGSDVEQGSPPVGYDDRWLREKLRSRGIKIFEATAVFFQPRAYDSLPHLRPVDAAGAPQPRVDWYVGLCPSSEAYIEERAKLLQRVARQLEPDGLFLSFIRFPGFWETWVPGVDRGKIPEYCYCQRCLSRFSQETGHRVPRDAPSAAALLQGELRAAWTGWKCNLVAGVVGHLRQAVREVIPDIELMVNLVPFSKEELGGAVEELLGQRVESLTPFVELFEVMVYHQILKRDPRKWIPKLVADLRSRTDRSLVPCLQVRPTYLEGHHASARRRSMIGPEEFESCVEAVQSSGAGNIATYHWTDLLLEDKASAGAFSAALRGFVSGEANHGTAETAPNPEADN